MEFLTAKERKEPYIHESNNFVFKSVIDLSEPIIVHTGNLFIDKAAAELLLREAAGFIGVWVLSIHPLLNGFSGLDTLRWIIEE